MTTVDARNPVPILKCTCFCSVTTMIFSITLGYLVGGFNYFSIFTAIWGTFPFWLRGGNHQLVIKVDFRSINHQQWYVLSVKVPRFTWGFTRFEKKTPWGQSIRRQSQRRVLGADFCTQIVQNHLPILVVPHFEALPKRSQTEFEYIWAVFKIVVGRFISRIILPTLIHMGFSANLRIPLWAVRSISWNVPSGFCFGCSLTPI